METNNPSNQNPCIDTWESRIEKAAKVMGLNPPQVEEILNSPSFKITKEPCGLEMLSDESVTPFGDLRKLFCEDNEVAVPQLRMAIKYLRGDQKSKPTDTTITVDPDILDLQKKYGINIKFKLDNLGPEELIPLYNPTKKNAIYNSLIKKLGDKKIIAFKPDSNIVAIDETINYIVDLNDGYPEEDSIEVDGELVRLLPLGVLPNQEIEEDPLFPGSPLKRGRSIVNRIDWTYTSIETRQFFRILLNEKEINPNERLIIKATLDNNYICSKENLNNKDLVYFNRHLFPQSYLVFKEMKKKGELPKLTISISEATKSERTNNPFGINKRY